MSVSYQKPATLIDIRAEKCKRHFKYFVKEFWPEVDPDQFIDNWAVDCLCDHLQAVYKDELTDLVINIPPGMGKSIIISSMFPAWLWVQDPSNNTLCSTRTPQNGKRDANRFYNLLKSPKFKNYYGHLFKVGYAARKENDMKISEDIKDIQNSEKGYRRFIVTGAPSTTGARGKIILLDDPNDRSDVSSQVTRDRINDYVFKTLSTRNFAKLGGKMIIVMQRLHEDDVAGVAIEKGFELLRIPMQYDEDHVSIPLVTWKDPRKKGEFINPELYDEKSKKITLMKAGAMEYETQYQQHPSVMEGNMIKTDWIKDNEAPRNDKGELLCEDNGMYFDLTFKGNDNSDYVAGHFWTRYKGQYYLADRIRKKMDFMEQLKALQNFYNKYKPNCLRIEDSANAAAVYSVIKERVPNCTLVKVKGDKETRLNRVAPIFEAGNVNIASRFHDVINELLVFPNGKNDDNVDATSMALDDLRQEKVFFYSDPSRL